VFIIIEIVMLLEELLMIDDGLLLLLLLVMQHCVIEAQWHWLILTVCVIDPSIVWCVVKWLVIDVVSIIIGNWYYCVILYCVMTVNASNDIVVLCGYWPVLLLLLVIQWNVDGNDNSDINDIIVIELLMCVIIQPGIIIDRPATNDLVLWYIVRRVIDYLLLSSIDDCVMAQWCVWCDWLADIV